jgi:hypothetical protein
MENPQPLTKEIYNKAKEFGVDKIVLNWSGGSDEGHLYVVFYPYINDSVKITQLEKMVDKWAWDVYSYSGAGAGSDYGDDIEYDLVNGTVSTSEWYTARVDGGSKELALQIEAD